MKTKDRFPISETERLTGLPSNVDHLLFLLEQAGFEAYVVGGAVRDMLLGIDPNDYDIFTNASGVEILKLFPDGNIIGGEERQKKILTVVVDGVEISQYRKSGDRTLTGDSLEDHLNTCDFTINALAIDRAGKFYDYVGGADDLLHRKILSFVGDAGSRIAEDRLRILRGVRFLIKYNLTYAYQFDICIHYNKLRNLPVERIREEYIKILALDNIAHNKHFRSFTEWLIPSVRFLTYLPGGQHHAEFVGDHLYHSLEEACKVTSNPVLRLACLIHDIGKYDTYEVSEGGVHFYRHEESGEKTTLEFMEHYRFSNDEILYVTKLIRNHLFGRQDGKELKRKSYNKIFGRLERYKIPLMDFMVLLYSDYQGNQKNPRIGFSEYVQNNRGYLIEMYYDMKYTNEPFTVKGLAISGHDLMDKHGYKEGRAIGDILKHLFDKVVEGELANEKIALTTYVKNLTFARNNK